MKFSPIQKRMALVLSGLMAATLVACGGGSGAGPNVKTGYFIDSAVEGLRYQSGSQSGYTDSNGTFRYEEGQPVTFSIGKLELGSLVVKNSRVFPVDLIDGAADESHPTVSLMAQILQTLDSDGDPSNGITISDRTRTGLGQVIELASTDLAAAADALVQLLSSSNSLGLPVSALVSATDAKTHLQNNLVKEYAGTWTGSFSGDDSGDCSIDISDSGSITGKCRSQQLNAEFPLLGQVSSSGESAAGDATTGAAFGGTYSRSGEVSGTWKNETYNNTNGSDYAGTWRLKKN
ncbi:hypothetical protein [uncultured Limnohabitans sp.]|jgi:hypothetical protein|uniref:hypothetical protein n=1 Tax=uncultured Limnohabitans sp. TaxID=768543 RepID=UPI00260F0E0A|nr:hypothetical protein [uncultured Limnohabitans sp.]